jgi:hypothetical protein
MPVGDEEETVVVILHPHPVGQGAVQVAQVKRTGGRMPLKIRFLELMYASPDRLIGCPRVPAAIGRCLILKPDILNRRPYAIKKKRGDGQRESV